MTKEFTSYVLTRLFIAAVMLLICLSFKAAFAEEKGMFTSVVSVEKQCKGWGFGVGKWGVSNTDCKYICHHWKLDNGDWKEVKTEECDIEDYHLVDLDE